MRVPRFPKSSFLLAQLMSAKRDSRPSRSKRRDRQDHEQEEEVLEGEEAGNKRSSKKGAEPQEGPGTVRIIGGKHRGRSLIYSGDIRTRPMKDRVRESLFNLVSTFCDGRVAIDLFAGTGALGLEAISRGSPYAILIERHLPTSITISKNVESLGEKESCEVCFADTFLWIRRALEQVDPTSMAEGAARPAPRQVIPGQASSTRFLKNGLPWIIFCSPPYEFFLARSEEMETLIRSLWRAAPENSVLVIESDIRVTPIELWPDLAHDNDDWDIRDYPPARIGILLKESAE